MTCDSCRYFLPQSDTQGLCRRFPPTVKVYDNGPITSIFPPILHEGWCGEHKEREQ